jgi:cytoskeletal protein CcmA (bactofilin family)
MADNLNTIIGKNAIIDGKLEVQGHLRIDGSVRGSVKCLETVTIGPEGTVEADIITKSAIVTGAVKGNIEAEERLELQAKSVVNGDIKTRSLVVEQGAIFQGACMMKDNHLSKISDKDIKQA